LRSQLETIRAYAMTYPYRIMIKLLSKNVYVFF
jgi:hypothetical protein